jgi:hypothetical protein
VQPPKLPTIKKMVEPISNKEASMGYDRRRRKNNYRCPTCA